MERDGGLTEGSWCVVRRCGGRPRGSAGPLPAVVYRHASQRTGHPLARSHEPRPRHRPGRRPRRRHGRAAVPAAAAGGRAGARRHRASTSTARGWQFLESPASCWRSSAWRRFRTWPNVRGRTVATLAIADLAAGRRGARARCCSPGSLAAGGHAGAGPGRRGRCARRSPARRWAACSSARPAARRRRRRVAGRLRRRRGARAGGDRDLRRRRSRSWRWPRSWCCSSGAAAAATASTRACGSCGERRPRPKKLVLAVIDALDPGRWSRRSRTDRRPRWRR